MSPDGVIGFGALGVIILAGWITAAVVIAEEGNPRRAARMVLLTPICPIILCALLGIYATKGVNALLRAAEIGQPEEQTEEQAEVEPEGPQPRLPDPWGPR